MAKVKSFRQVIWKPHQKQPDIRPIGRRIYRLEEDVVYTWIGNYNGKTQYFENCVKTGFICDGQSSPRIAWPIPGMRPDGLVRMASLVHDAQYRTSGCKRSGDMGVTLYADGVFVSLSQKACDQVFRAAYIETSPADASAARFAYRMLRLFGWTSFGRRTPPGQGK